MKFLRFHGLTVFFGNENTKGSLKQEQSNKPDKFLEKSA